jgi:hypothetical protein
MDDTHAVVHEEQRAQTQLAVGAMLVPIFIVILFAACILGTYHKPDQNRIKIGVVGPATQTAARRAGLEKSASSAVAIWPAATIGGAVHDVRQSDLDAAIVPTVNPKPYWKSLLTAVVMTGVAGWGGEADG